MRKKFSGDKMPTVDETLKRLEKSKFRASFHLSKKEKDYFNEKGRETVRRHAEDFIRQRLAPAEIPNDGRQTPMRGHPVFIAQHACACCCRGCLEKWYKVKQGTALDEDRQKRIVDLLMTWIEREIER